jgi:uncharacterized protein YcaQ
VAFLAPLDPLCWDRDLLRRLFAFDYVWEVYVPEAKRRWGYYVLPILYGDRIVGRIEPRLERRTRSLRIVDLWWEPGFDPFEAPGFIDAFADALVAHRAFGGLDSIDFPRSARHRRFVTGVRGALGTRGSTNRRNAPRRPDARAVGRCAPRPSTARAGRTAPD